MMGSRGWTSRPRTATKGSATVSPARSVPAQLDTPCKPARHACGAAGRPRRCRTRSMRSALHAQSRARGRVLARPPGLSTVPARSFRPRFLRGQDRREPPRGSPDARCRRRTAPWRLPSTLHGRGRTPEPCVCTGGLTVPRRRRQDGSALSGQSPATISASTSVRNTPRDYVAGRATTRLQILASPRKQTRAERPNEHCNRYCEGQRSAGE